MQLALEQFDLDKEWIFWALIFFKSGYIAKWSKNLFYQKANTGIFPLQSWLVFEHQFQAQFFPVNVEVNDTNTLEGSSYYQNNQMVENYLDSFQSLVSDAGYSNLRTLVVKFWKGLWTGIQKQITTMLVGYPSNTNLKV